MDHAEPVTAVVVDDHVAIRDGVSSWFAATRPPIAIVASGNRVSLAWHPPGSEADVVVLDLQLEAHGRQEFAELRRLVDAGRRVVVYTQDISRDTAVRAVGLGALAVVTKSEGKEHLVAAVVSAAGGLSYTPPALSGSLLVDDDPARPRLTPMELAALRTWFSSSSKGLAARTLGISAKTLDTYITRARVKYAGAGRAAPSKSRLVQRALEDGLVSLEDLKEDGFDGPDRQGADRSGPRPS